MKELSSVVITFLILIMLSLGIMIVRIEQAHQKIQRLESYDECIVVEVTTRDLESVINTEVIYPEDIK